MPAAQHVGAGAACSEVFSGPRLAQVLRPALEHQRRLETNREKGSWRRGVPYKWPRKL